jgi:hypothetical protein
MRVFSCGLPNGRSRILCVKYEAEYLLGRFERAMRYQLFYRQHLIASIEEKNAEFPSFFGHYQLEPIADVPELAHVRAYIDFCVRVSPHREQERFDDPAMLQEEESFTDLIESPDWSLVETKTQQRTPILIPIFFTDGVTWRLNPDYPDIKTHETA